MDLPLTLGTRLFETPIGACALAWGDSGLTAVWLPEATPDTLRRRLHQRFPQAVQDAEPPATVQAAIEDIIALLSGESRDLLQVSLDMRAIPDFHQRVYRISRAIPPGRTLTYGEIATQLGDAREARAVGQALGRNPFPIVVPCHRVLAASGGYGGFSAPGGVETKLRLLAIEGARSTRGPDLFD